MKRGRLVGLPLTLAVLMSALSVQAQGIRESEDFGFVIEMIGQWDVNTQAEKKKIEKGQALPVESTVSTLKPSNFYSITILPLDGSRPQTYACKHPGVCDSPILLKRQKKEASVATRIVKAAGGFFARRPDRYLSTLSRGGGTLQDAVVKLTNASIDLSPVFQPMPKGTYRLRLEPLTGDKAMKSETAGYEVTLVWEPEKSAQVKVNGLHSGLYRLSFGEEDFEAWILASESGVYEKSLPAFQEAVHLTSRWGNDVKPTVAQSFLRAYLEFLALEGVR